MILWVGWNGMLFDKGVRFNSGSPYGYLQIGPIMFKRYWKRFRISVVVTPLKEDGTYTLQVSNNPPVTFKEVDHPREKMIDSFDRHRTR